MVLATPVYLIARVIFIKAKGKKTNWYHEVVLFILIIFIVGLASQTVIPKFKFDATGIKVVKTGTHKTNLIPFKVLFVTYNEVIVKGNINHFLINFLGNIIVFIPFGFFIPLLWKVSNKKVVFIGFCFSLFIEISQLFLTRYTDVDDLILNTIGVLIGLFMYKYFYRNFRSFVLKLK